MSALLRVAFGVFLDRISGPAWLRSESYDITATMPPETTKEQLRMMLRDLLAERFHLEMHKETRSYPGYDLAVDKNGPKLKEVSPHTRPPEDTATPDMLDFVPTYVPRANTPDGFPVEVGPRTLERSISSTGMMTTKYQERTIADFLSYLGPRIGFAQGRGIADGDRQPIVADRTGLKGTYILSSSTTARVMPPPPIPLAVPISLPQSEPSWGYASKRPLMFPRM